MLNLNLKTNLSFLWKGVIFVLGMSFLLMPFVVPLAEASPVAVIKQLHGSRYYSTSKPFPKRSRWNSLTKWWNDNLWGSREKEENDIAASRSVTDQQDIHMLKGEQKIVGAGNRLLYLGWIGKDNCSSYEVTVKRKGSYGFVGKKTSTENFTSLSVNLKKGHYEIKVTKCGQSKKGEFEVITSRPNFFPNKDEKLSKKERIGWALELLTEGKYQWSFEAYQQVAGIQYDEAARQLKIRLEEGMSIPVIYSF